MLLIDVRCLTYHVRAAVWCALEKRVVRIEDLLAHEQVPFATQTTSVLTVLAYKKTIERFLIVL